MFLGVPIMYCRGENLLRELRGSTVTDFAHDSDMWAVFDGNDLFLVCEVLVDAA